MDIEQELRGYSLTTAEIIYTLPDYTSLLQVYVWQEYDLHPHFPKLKDFLDFWTKHLDGPLYRITVAHSRLLRPREVRILTGGELKLN